MAAKKQASIDAKLKQRPALDPEEREKQMIALAVNRVEERMRNGEASSAEYVHYLKLASRKEELEREKLELEKELLVAKTEALQSTKRIEELYTQAISAMQVYQGKVEDYE